MTAARSSINPALTALATLVAMMLAEAPNAVAQDSTAQADASELKWTPHRASKPAVELAEAPAESAFEPPLASASPVASAPDRKSTRLNSSH